MSVHGGMGEPGCMGANELCRGVHGPKLRLGSRGCMGAHARGACAGLGLGSRGHKAAYAFRGCTCKIAHGCTSADGFCREAPGLDLTWLHMGIWSHMGSTGRCMSWFAQSMGVWTSFASNRNGIPGYS